MDLQVEIPHKLPSANSALERPIFSIDMMKEHVINDFRSPLNFSPTQIAFEDFRMSIRRLKSTQQSLSPITKIHVDALRLSIRFVRVVDDVFVKFEFKLERFFATGNMTVKDFGPT